MIPFLIACTLLAIQFSAIPFWFRASKMGPDDRIFIFFSAWMFTVVPAVVILVHLLLSGIGEVFKLQ